jgi:hypothetical protein
MVFDPVVCPLCIPFVAPGPAFVAPGPTFPELDAPGAGCICANALPADNASAQADAIKIFFMQELPFLAFRTGAQPATTVSVPMIKPHMRATQIFHCVGTTLPPSRREFGWLVALNCLSCEHPPRSSKQAPRTWDS